MANNGNNELMDLRNEVSRLLSYKLNARIHRELDGYSMDEENFKMTTSNVKTLTSNLKKSNDRVLKLSKKLLNKKFTLTDSDFEALTSASKALEPLNKKVKFTVTVTGDKKGGKREVEKKLLVLGCDHLKEMEAISKSFKKQLADAKLKYKQPTIEAFLKTFSTGSSLNPLYIGANPYRIKKIIDIQADLAEINKRPVNSADPDEKKRLTRGCLLYHKKDLSFIHTTGRLESVLNDLLESPALKTGNSKSADMAAFNNKFQKQKPTEPSAFKKFKGFFNKKKSSAYLDDTAPAPPKKDDRRPNGIF